MKILFFDTETTGLPKSPNASYTDIDNWPRLVQLAWLVYEDGKLISQKDIIVKPIGFSIPNSATSVHGITNELANEQGIKLEEALKQFSLISKSVDAIVGHNIDFDINIIMCEFHRLGLKSNLFSLPKIDTMMESIDFCAIPNRYSGYRYPKLLELYSKLFHSTFEDAHNAYSDIFATSKCFWELVRKGVISKTKYTFLLTQEERKGLIEKYNKEAIEIIWGTRRGSFEDAETLYLKSAELGSPEGMYKVALLNMGGKLSSIRKDYNIALKWLLKILELPKDKIRPWYSETLKDLIKIYREKGNTYKVSFYQEKLDKHTEETKSKILASAYESEANFYNLVISLLNGNNGFLKDTAKGYELMSEGVEKGYRSLYWLYAQHLIELHDDKYFFFLLEAIKDTEQKLEEERKYMSHYYTDRSASYMYRTHKDFWLTEKYRLVAEGYLTGFGVNKDISKALEYIRKALSCDTTDYETSFLFARVMNGEFGNSMVDYDRAISQLERLPIKYMDKKIVWAILGDSYFGKGFLHYFKAKSCYNNYPDIDKYKSPLRSKYKRFCLFINLFILVAIILWVAVKLL